jgi:DNA-directed RNA polymerase II subunit RPB4
LILNKADISISRMLVKTMDYLDHFARFKRKENVEAVERLLSAHQELAKFERAQLGKSHHVDHTSLPYTCCTNNKS